MRRVTTSLSAMARQNDGGRRVPLQIIVEWFNKSPAPIAVVATAFNLAAYYPAKQSNTEENFLRIELCENVVSNCWNKSSWMVGVFPVRFLGVSCTGWTFTPQTVEQTLLLKYVLNFWSFRINVAGKDEHETWLNTVGRQISHKTRAVKVVLIL